MSAFHVTRQGSEVHVRGNIVEAWAEAVRVAVARLPLLDTVVLHGGVGITTPALSRLLAHDIDLVFLAADGRFKGRVETLGSRAAELRTAQARIAAHPTAASALAAIVVSQKLVSQYRVLNALRAQPGRPLAWHLRGLRDATSIHEVRGLEGFATRVYFESIRKTGALPPAWVRARRPPPDGFNALLSYGYALLQSRVHAAVAMAGLDPWLGFLHAAGRPRPGLVLDLMEEFRAPVVDFFVLRFARGLPGEAWLPQQEGGVRMHDSVRREFIQRFEARLQRRTVHAPSGTRTTLLRCIELQARAMAAAIRGDAGALAPFHRAR